MYAVIRTRKQQFDPKANTSEFYLQQSREGKQFPVSFLCSLMFVCLNILIEMT